MNEKRRCHDDPARTDQVKRKQQPVSGNSRPPVKRAGALIIAVSAVLITLKLTRVIAWPWWQVLFPLLVTAGMVLAVLFALCAAWLYRQ